MRALGRKLRENKGTRRYLIKYSYQRKSIVRVLIILITILLIACQPQQSSEQQKNTTKKSLQISQFSAHWITPDTILVAQQYSNDEMTLTLSIEPPTAQLKVKSYPLTLKKNEHGLNKKYRHLSRFNAYSVDINHQKIKALLKQPLVVFSKTKDDLLAKGTYLQTAALIDILYTSGENDADEVSDLGAVIVEKNVQFKLWAPTAKSVSVLLFEQDKTPAVPHQLIMIEDTKTGIWLAKADKSLANKYYRYQIEVYHPASKKVETLITTDPYSLSLSTNSEYSQIIDLNDPDTMPSGWKIQQDNPVVNPEDNIFYETHIRDFSAHDSGLKNQRYRGKYLAFTDLNSHGMRHLKKLRDAGINSIHLLPSFDIGTINEDAEQVIDNHDSLERACRITKIKAVCDLKTDKSTSIAQYLESLPKQGKQQQALISALRSFDNYNWGYDPFHYTVPEGSYAVNPEGKARIVEFRTMVAQLHNLGFRVIMDVVYNHTHQAGLESTAVLDKIVPNYYHRLDPITGVVEQSTCCDNTATERVMMEKLMIDSLIVWTRDYRIDGFRFDLMAHQPKSAMLKARAQVQKIDPDNYFYGEGWNFGEVANNQQFIQASQLELAGTSIGTFTDRLRDAVRGGAFNATGAEIRKSQGIGNGLASFPNELQVEGHQKYLTSADQLRIGLTGNLANYPLLTANDEIKLGKEIPYGDQPSGYALTPADTINYVSKHDNQSLWDNNQYRIAYHLDTHQRVRMQLQSLSFALFAQGIPFIHMGTELLRSKGFLRDSYDYGDWFNKVDFSKQDNNYNIGLPPAEKDQQNWQIISDVIAANAGKDIVSPTDIAYSSAVFIDLVKIRMSSALFRLTTAQEIIDTVKFHNTGSQQKPGLIAMSIDGSKYQRKTGNNYSQLVIIFNTTNKNQLLAYPNAGTFKLHPVQQGSVDRQVKMSVANGKGFTVPPLTTAVFVQEKNAKILRK
ncbi:MAG: pullulanase-type alpha-1,6-glucosidase [Colwellia sp.]|nr:pullulanase-type alpha-1,6-glucosidase [Colwellia sp.]